MLGSGFRGSLGPVRPGPLHPPSWPLADLVYFFVLLDVTSNNDFLPVTTYYSKFEIQSKKVQFSDSRGRGFSFSMPWPQAFYAMTPHHDFPEPAHQASGISSIFVSRLYFWALGHQASGIFQKLGIVALFLNFRAPILLTLFYFL